MSDALAKKLEPQSDVMTVERLRKHLFGGPQVPFWNYDPAQLTIGIEVEYFIAHLHADGSFKLATKNEYLEVMDHLKHESGYKDRHLPDQPGRVSRDTEQGFVAIKPDFAWHILEISLPPRGKLAELRTLMEKVFAEVDAALAKVNLVRLDRSSLPDVPEHIELVELDRLGMFTTAVKQRSSDNPFINPEFPAYITATHVHLNVFDHSAFELFPRLYELETATFGLYARPSYFAGRFVMNPRDIFMNHTMGQNYRLKGIPDRIPKNMTDYVALMNESDFLFPNDRFFPVRDVSYIRPSKYGTLEFRSSCSYIHVESLIEVVSWRILQLCAAAEPIGKSDNRLSHLLNKKDHLQNNGLICQNSAAQITQRLKNYMSTDEKPC